MSFNLFVLPFLLGVVFLFFSIGKRYVIWVRTLPAEDRRKFRNGMRNGKVFAAFREIFDESLLHRRMFRKNRMLGYMHMSFAFGWLLLIVFGNMESRIYSGWWVNPPYYPIFLKFFIHDKKVLPFEFFTVPGFFRFSMDLLLVFILSGLVLALIKRGRSNWFGLKKTTKYQLTDKIAMTCLWLIFPFRLLAESFTAGAYGYGGGFITQYLGNVLAALWPFPDKQVAYGFWWLYSLSLGIFFVTLPYSRYMHIPTEVMLILFRNFGIKPVREECSFSEVEVLSCPKCGVCIDACQVGTSAGIWDMQAVYFIQSVRHLEVKTEIALKCMLCGRCLEACPVGINTDSQRLMQRNKIYREQPFNYSYLKPEDKGTAEILYFAGCMTHLTPGIIRSMEGIFNRAGIGYLFLDEDRTVCCGRPLMLSGKEKQAESMIRVNKKMIEASGASLLVTSCPICYRVFREEYGLSIRVLHHSEYILDLVKTGRIPLQSYFRKVAYHDPCDLGRGTKVFEAPRELLEKISDLVDVKEQEAQSLCCGGSLGAFTLDQEQRDRITRDTVATLLQNRPNVVATACPLCKKTLARQSATAVKDIAELVFESIPEHN